MRPFKLHSLPIVLVCSGLSVSCHEKPPPPPPVATIAPTSAPLPTPKPVRKLTLKATCRFTATHAKGADPTRRKGVPAAALDKAASEKECLSICLHAEKEERNESGKRRLTTACWYGKRLLFTHDFVP